MTVGSLASGFRAGRSAYPGHGAPHPQTKNPGRIVPDEQVEILPPGRGLVLDWRVIAPTVALGTVTGFAASLVVGGGGLLRHAVVGLLGMLVGQGLVRLTGWRVRTAMPASTTWRWP